LMVRQVYSIIPYYAKSGDNIITLHP
ncbi:MAG: hypothetical protein JWQ01_3572, partial [Massilia sp.]|nr:hypothetical protein [Massilia sp.]